MADMETLSNIHVMSCEYFTSAIVIDSLLLFACSSYVLIMQFVLCAENKKLNRNSRNEQVNISSSPKVNNNKACSKHDQRLIQNALGFFLPQFI